MRIALWREITYEFGIQEHFDCLWKRIETQRATDVGR